MYVALGLVVFGGLVLFANRGPQAKEIATGTAAPAFTLTSTSGEQVSLADFQGRNVLLYFNEGVGCDACFFQMNELEQEQNAAELAKANITVLPIAVNDPADIKRDMARMGLVTPWLVDADKSVSAAYGTLGTGMHADLPGHSFVFIDASGEIKWQQDYPSMFASMQEIMSKIRPLL